MPDCPMLKLVLASTRKIERTKGDGAEKTEGLEHEDEDKLDEEEGK